MIGKDLRSWGIMLNPLKTSRKPLKLVLEEDTITDEHNQQVESRFSNMEMYEIYILTFMEALEGTHPTTTAHLGILKRIILFQIRS